MRGEDIVAVVCEKVAAADAVDAGEKDVAEIGADERDEVDNGRLESLCALILRAGGVGRLFQGRWRRKNQRVVFHSVVVGVDVDVQRRCDAVADGGAGGAGAVTATGGGANTRVRTSRVGCFLLLLLRSTSCDPSSRAKVKSDES